MGSIPKLSLAVLVALAACSGGSTAANNKGQTGYPADPGVTPVQAVTVEVIDDAFSPSSVVVAVGGTVTWHWTGGHGHSVTPDGSPIFSPQAGVSYPPKELVVTFDQAGTYTYHCIVHGVDGYGNAAGMIGVVYVR